MYFWAKELVRWIILLFAMAWCTVYGWNAFGVEFLGSTLIMTYGEAVGMWLLVYSTMLFFAISKFLFYNNESGYNVHHHFEAKKEEEDG